MPLYFFDTDDGAERHRDEIGQVLAAPRMVRAIAIDALPSMVCPPMSDGETGRVAISVRDEEGRVVFDADLTLNARWQMAAGLPEG